VKIGIFRVSIAILASVFVFSSNVKAQTACGFAVTATSDVATKIANGHAWTEHSSEYVAGRVMAGLAMPASPAINSIATFRTHILSALASSTNKALSGGRKAWWLASTGTFVVFNPSDADCGTAFRPTDGKAYYDRQT
jgi:hypothetical protein